MTETVPGMAEAIRRRAEQRGLTPGLFVELSGLTEPGLRPVREGVRKQYAAKTRRGVAVALAWPLDWYDRLLAGDSPDDFPTVEHSGAPRSIEQRISSLEEQVRQLAAWVRDELRPPE